MTATVLAPTRQHDQVRVRPIWSTGGVGRALMLDRRWATLSPFMSDEWHRTRAGVWLPTATTEHGAQRWAPQRRMQPWRGYLPGFQYAQVPIGVGMLTSNTASQNVTAMNATYAINSTGNALAVVFGVAEAKEISKVYYYNTAVTGTPATQDVEIRPMHASIYKPSLTVLLASNTFTYTFAANTWYSTTGAWSSTPTLTAGTLYWVILCNKLAAATTNYTSPLRDLNDGLDGATIYVRDFFRVIVTSNGFTTITDTARKGAGLIVTFTDGTLLGAPLVTEAVNSSTTKHRGIRCEEWGFYSKLHGALFASNANSISGVKWYWGSALPNAEDTAISNTGFTSLLKNSVGDVTGVLLKGMPRLKPDASFRVSLQVTGSTDKPNDASYGTNGVDDTVRAALPGGGKWYKTEDSGSNTWTDDTTKIPRLGFLAEDVWSSPLG